MAPFKEGFSVVMPRVFRDLKKCVPHFEECVPHWRPP
jgi:hypothetical protein